MANQRLDKYVECAHHFKICVAVQIISPFSEFPFRKFLCQQRQLHTNFFNIDVWQQSSDIQHKQTPKFLVIYPTIAVWVSNPQNILHLTANSNNCVMSSLVLIDQPMHLVDCALGWGLQLDIQRHLRKCSEYFFKSWHLFFIGTDRQTFRCKVQLDFCFKRRQIFKIVVANETVHSTCPFELLVMMNNQNSIFSLADIQLEHITMLGCIFKGLNGIFGDISGTTTMSNSQNSRSIYGLLQALSLKSVALVKQGWEKEQNDAEGGITSKYEEQGHPDHNGENIITMNTSGTNKIKDLVFLTFIY